jgi:S1-C subfamily serine protease
MLIKRALATLLVILTAFALPLEAKEIRDIYNSAKQSVALILTYDAKGMPLAIGSGFFIEKDKLITNHHVIDGAANTVVRTIKSESQHNIKETVSYSESMDIAILRVDTERTPLPTKSAQDQQIGDKVVAIGNPKGLEGSVSEGIISGLRPVDDFKVYQITAPISPGSSGGPLFDRDGNVIGITTASISDGQNLNFAIPIALVDRLKKSGKR